jgi:hypothetical protein
MINLTGNNNRAREWWHKHIMGSRISCVKNNARKNPGGKETCIAKDVGVEKIYEHVQFRG